MKFLSSDELKNLRQLRNRVPGVWSWEANSWPMNKPTYDLYADRGEPLFPEEPAGLGNIQHGYKIIRGDIDTFDSNGEAVREFIVSAHQSILALLDEIESRRSVPSQPSTDDHSDYVDLEDDAMKDA